MRASLIAGALWLLGAGSAGLGDPQHSDQALVTVTIPCYLAVEAEPVEDWHRGILFWGVLGPPGGADPEWSGGSINDRWPMKNNYDGPMPFSTGAAARGAICVRANCGVRLQLSGVPTRPNIGPLPLLGNPACYLRFCTTLAWPHDGGFIKPGSSADQRVWGNAPGEDASTYLYACVERKGLQDRAGTYQTQALLTLTPLSP